MSRNNKRMAIEKANIALQKRKLNENFGEASPRHPIYALTDVMKELLRSMTFNELEQLTNEALGHLSHELFPNGIEPSIDDNAPVESRY